VAYHNIACCFYVRYLILGNRISLISKKDIRYEGTLYSINEENSTVALQNVRSYGTEGREKQDPSTTFVAPQDAVHPYLLFRGCDIKDLHVHEQAAAKPADDPAIVSNSAPPEAALPPPHSPQEPKNAQTSAPANAQAKHRNEKENQQHQQRPKQPYQNQGGRGGGNKRERKPPNPVHQVGTGASLLNRKARGSVEGGEYFPFLERYSCLSTFHV
jgi:protein LSM14